MFVWYIPIPFTGVLQKNIVAFLPLDAAEMATVSRFELTKLAEKLRKDYATEWDGQLDWTTDVPSLIGNRCLNDVLCYNDGGRGVATFIEQEVQERAVDALTELLSSGCSPCYGHIQVSVDENSEVSARIDNVYDVDGQFQNLREDQQEL